MKKIIGLLICILCLCGCGKKDNKTEVTELELALEGNPTTGYEWQCEIDNDSIANMVSNKYIPDKSNNEMTGVGGTYKFIYEGISAGTTTIVCSYYRSFEVEEPLYKLEYVVTVNDKTKEISQYSKSGTYLKETIPDLKTIRTTK